MAALAVGMLLIIFLTGRPEDSALPRPARAEAVTPSADRVRDYQERLRLLDQQTARDAAAAPTSEQPSMPAQPGGEATARVDPLVEERRRREYESLFASNVAFSRRSGHEQPMSAAAGGVVADSAGQGPTAEPSIDDIVDAVVRARARGVISAPVGLPSSVPPTGPAKRAENESAPVPTRPISAAGPLHRVLEGTVIDAVLTNRLDGGAAAPVNCLVTNPLYSHSGQHVLIPAGARVLGETRPVQSFGEARLAVAFHRLLMPDGSTWPLEQFKGLNQIGDAGLRDRVNHHYWSTFGAAAAVGLVTGLSQLLGSAGLGLGDGDRTVIIAGSAADATAQASAQVMSRFLNRLPTITIREGHRVKVYITSDLNLPEWSPLSASRVTERR